MTMENNYLHTYRFSDGENENSKINSYHYNNDLL